MNRLETINICCTYYCDQYEEYNKKQLCKLKTREAVRHESEYLEYFYTAIN